MSINHDEHTLLIPFYVGTPAIGLTALALRPLQDTLTGRVRLEPTGAAGQVRVRMDAREPYFSALDFYVIQDDETWVPGEEAGTRWCQAMHRVVSYVRHGLPGVTYPSDSPFLLPASHPALVASTFARRAPALDAAVRPERLLDAIAQTLRNRP